MTSRVGIWLTGLCCFSAIVVICLARMPALISGQIKDSLDTVFTEAGLESIDYEIDGRDVIFSGEISINANRLDMFNTARSVPGIRNIVDNQSVYQPQPAFGQILIENGVAKFTGGFRNAATLDLISELLHKYFSDHEIIIEAQTSEKMIPMQQLLDFEYLLQRFQGSAVWFEFSDRRIVLNGRFTTEHALALVEQKILSEISKNTRYLNDIKILGEDASETIVFEKSKDGISINGELAEYGLKTRLGQLFKAYYPNSNVNINLTVNDQLQHIEWHNKLGFLVSELDRLIEGKFKFYQEEIVLEGTVDSISTKTGLISRIKESLEGSVVIDNLTIQGT